MQVICIVAKFLPVLACHKCSYIAIWSAVVCMSVCMNFSGPYLSNYTTSGKKKKLREESKGHTSLAYIVAGLEA